MPATSTRVPLEARPQIQALFAEPVPYRKLVGYAALCRQLYERLGPLARVLRAGAAAGDSELRQLIDTVEQERLLGTASIAAHLSAVGALRPGLTVERAGHRLWAINAGETGDALVLRCGWSLDEYEALDGRDDDLRTAPASAGEWVNMTDDLGTSAPVDRPGCAGDGSIDVQPRHANRRRLDLRPGASGRDVPPEAVLHLPWSTPC